VARALGSVTSTAIAAALIAGGALYFGLRLRRSPRAYRATIAVAVCYLGAGAVLGGLVVYLVTFGRTGVREEVTRGGGAAELSSANLPNRFTARVVSITDGDTITVSESGAGEQLIRLAGIDAPEHDQPFGAQSTQHLVSLVSGKTVALDCESERSYGRLICKILLRNGEDACLDQVKAGMAWHYKQYQDEQSPGDRDTYAAAECAAMKAKIGLWSDPHPIQPQDWRHATHSPMLLDANGCRTTSKPTSGPVVGDAQSHVFEWPGCPYYGAISPGRRVPFPNPQAAEAAGFRPARNCP
jgi:endonuclease YncB( thermonuclease family)